MVKQSSALEQGAETFTVFSVEFMPCWLKRNINKKTSIFTVQSLHILMCKASWGRTPWGFSDWEEWPFYIRITKPGSQPNSSQLKYFKDSQVSWFVFWAQEQVISQDLCFIKSGYQKLMYTKQQTHPRKLQNVNWSFIFPLLLFSLPKWTGKMIFQCKSLDTWVRIRHPYDRNKNKT